MKVVFIQIFMILSFASYSQTDTIYTYKKATDSASFIQLQNLENKEIEDSLNKILLQFPSSDSILIESSDEYYIVKTSNVSIVFNNKDFLTIGYDSQITKYESPEYIENVLSYNLYSFSLNLKNGKTPTIKDIIDCNYYENFYEKMKEKIIATGDSDCINNGVHDSIKFSPSQEVQIYANEIAITYQECTANANIEVYHDILIPFKEIEIYLLSINKLK